MEAAQFALNHMTAPKLTVPEFFKLARSLGLTAVEIRNDLEGNAMLDGTAPDEIRREAEAAGIEIVSINALQRFNEWTMTRKAEAEALIAYAHDCGARALVLVPTNDGSGQVEGERQEGLKMALAALKPLLQEAGVIGLIEPLGFTVCSLRSKREAAEAIAAVGGEGVFKLVHDTFHHHLAGEPDLFPAMTGLVHISGVNDPDVTVADMLDSHRVLVDGDDRIDNAGQIRALIAAGYEGPFSFEPFADSVHASSDQKAAVAASIKYLVATV
ncbi:MAG: TIM barrel protein [Allorhizobium sp.]